MKSDEEYVWIMDPTKSFLSGGKVRPPGTPFKVKRKTGEYLVEKWPGCVFVEEPDGGEKPAPTAPKPAEEPDPPTGSAPESEPDPRLGQITKEPEPENDGEDLDADSSSDEVVPISLGGGWFQYKGEKMRRKELPPEAVEAYMKATG